MLNVPLYNTVLTPLNNPSNNPSKQPINAFEQQPLVSLPGVFYIVQAADPKNAEMEFVAQ